MSFREPYHPMLISTITAASLTFPKVTGAGRSESLSWKRTGLVACFGYGRLVPSQESNQIVCIPAFNTAILLVPLLRYTSFQKETVTILQEVGACISRRPGHLSFDVPLSLLDSFSSWKTVAESLQSFHSMRFLFHSTGVFSGILVASNMGNCGRFSGYCHHSHYLMISLRVFFEYYGMPLSWQNAKPWLVRLLGKSIYMWMHTDSTEPENIFGLQGGIWSNSPSRQVRWMVYRERLPWLLPGISFLWFQRSKYRFIQENLFLHSG